MICNWSSFQFYTCRPWTCSNFGKVCYFVKFRIEILIRVEGIAKLIFNFMRHYLVHISWFLVCKTSNLWSQNGGKSQMSIKSHSHLKRIVNSTFKREIGNNCMVCLVHFLDTSKMNVDKVFLVLIQDYCVWQIQLKKAERCLNLGDEILDNQNHKFYLFSN